MKHYKSYIKVIGLSSDITNDTIDDIQSLESVQEYISTKAIEINITFDKIYLAGENVYKLQRAYDDIENFLEKTIKII